jgi:hypothetical protein
MFVQETDVSMRKREPDPLTLLKLCKREVKAASPFPRHPMVASKKGAESVVRPMNGCSGPKTCCRGHCGNDKLLHQELVENIWHLVGEVVIGQIEQLDNG